MGCYRNVSWRLLWFPIVLLQVAALAYCCLRAYRIRLYSIKIYGYIIHEFDPWFNYRATEYLAANGYERFFKWFDYMSWYPLGRPVGTTIYPGMQMVSVAIWEAMNKIPETKWILPEEAVSWIPKVLRSYFPHKAKHLIVGPMSLNDVCCMVPPWFGSVATLFTFLLARETSESTTAGVFAAAIMAIIPAHLMRSMGGEFDNECVAVSAFCLTLWLWARCVRGRGSWPWAISAGAAYAFAAATWGGYIFINNLVAIHACLLVVLGKYTTNLYLAYTLYYIVGTVGAMQVPVIGLTPLRSVEQMPSLLVFAGYQLIMVCDLVRARWGQKWTPLRFCFFRAGVWLLAGCAVGFAAWVLAQMGVFMPLGARIRGLFLEAVKTGNPLVDSVAEHRPASEQAYDHFLGSPRWLAVAGMLFCWHQRTPSKFLVTTYALTSYWYSLKMSRLIIICGPIVSVLAGFAIGVPADWALAQLVGFFVGAPEHVPERRSHRTGGMGSIIATIWRKFGGFFWPEEAKRLAENKRAFSSKCWMLDRCIRAVLGWMVLVITWNFLLTHSHGFIAHCNKSAKGMANPKLMFEAPQRDGRTIMVDDYVRGYEWIRDNTPEDARVMAWWDYGYQITGIANRTSIADGNTWNHEHIATLGRILTNTEKKCWNAMRHLADYALVWAGGRGDDMGKSPHLARIGNSVFPDHCGDDDPMCHKFGFYKGGKPTTMMANSFLYKAVNHEVQDGVRLNPKFWKHVHTTKNGLLRVFQVVNISEESKDWIADPANRDCDAPGSWYCTGNYPPALKPLIAKRRNFAQLEDFNKKGAEQSAYTKMIEEERKGTKTPKSEL